MRAVYRGIAYEMSEVSGETVETGIAAQFMGQRYRVRQATEVSKAQPKGMTYRGIPVTGWE
jgi:hypothetical protein